MFLFCLLVPVFETSFTHVCYAQDERTEIVQICLRHCEWSEVDILDFKIHWSICSCCHQQHFFFERASPEHIVVSSSNTRVFNIYTCMADGVDRRVRHGERDQEPQQPHSRPQRSSTVQCGPAVRRRVGRTSYQSKAAYAAKLKNGLRGRAWTVTHKINELAVTRLMEVIAAVANVLGKAVREVIRAVRKSCEQVAPLQRHKAFMAFYGEGTVNQANTCETGAWTASRNWWI